jgi:putative restriction endonuclease
MQSHSKYWWVNHSQTGKIELEEGYIWSPLTKKGGGRNQSYLNLSKTQIGDLIFSYINGKIFAVGVVVNDVTEAARPPEFGIKGDQWSDSGWLVPINWTRLQHSFRPKDVILQIAPLLPLKYSPLKSDGNGNQGCYLAEVDEILFKLILTFIEDLNPSLIDIITNIKLSIKDNTEEKLILSGKLPTTYKMQLIEARIGQGIFRMKLEEIEQECRITKLQEKAFLIASHIKPWRFSTDEERLDGNNGLLLSPHIDRLFDRGYISFKETGNLLISSKCPANVLYKWQVTSKENVGLFNKSQNNYLEYHRDVIFK